MEYRSVVPRDRFEIELLLRNGDVASILDALLSVAYYDADWRWAQNLCLSYLDHRDSSVRGLSATCLGHIARIHEKLDLEIVLARLAPLKTDPVIGSAVQDALEDIRFFLRFQ